LAKAREKREKPRERKNNSPPGAGQAQIKIKKINPARSFHFRMSFSFLVSRAFAFFAGKLSFRIFSVLIFFYVNC
jgi:hypothetical protein